jgi:hypothetical protein
MLRADKQMAFYLLVARLVATEQMLCDKYCEVVGKERGTEPSGNRQKQINTRCS